MLTPIRALFALRLSAVLCGALMVLLLLGPFQGLEQEFGLSDRSAHMIAAFALTLGLFVVAPRWRRTDLALVVVGLGAAVEVAQALTGRSMSASDLCSDIAGVGVALVPGMIEQFRRHVRTAPYETFASIRRRDRRRFRTRPAGATDARPAPPVPLLLGPAFRPAQNVRSD